MHMIVKGYEVRQQRNRVQGEQHRTRVGFKNISRTIIINIVKPNKELNDGCKKMHVNKEKMR